MCEANPSSDHQAPHKSFEHGAMSYVKKRLELILLSEYIVTDIHKFTKIPVTVAEAPKPDSSMVPAASFPCSCLILKLGTLAFPLIL